MKKIQEIRIEGMHCEACVRRVRAALEKVPEVRVLEVAIGTAQVETETERKAELRAAIEKTGFAVLP